MSIKHTVKATGMGYLVVVEDKAEEEELARFEVEDLERSSSGGLTGVFTVRSRLDTRRAISDYVMSERVSFDVGSSKEGFAKRIDALLPPPAGGAHIDWVQIVEAATFEMSALERAPVPVLDLADTEPVETVPHLVPFMIPERRPTILYGPGGTGKSMLASAIAAAVAGGAELLGWKCVKAEVLYLDWETEPGDIAWRVQRAANGLDIPTPTVHYMNLVQPLARSMHDVARTIAEHDVKLVIIDSVGMASSANRDGADASEGAIRFFRGLRELGTASLLIDHVTGDDMRRERTPKPYGSVYKYNAARNAFEVRLRETETDEHVVALIHQKSNLGPKHSDTEVEFIYGKDFVKLRRRGYTAGPSNEERVLAVLEGGPITHRSLTDVLNAEGDPISEVMVRITVRGLVGEGKVVVDGTGRVSLK